MSIVGQTILPSWTRYKKLRAIGAGAGGQVFLAEAIECLAPHISPGLYVIKRITISASEEMLKGAATEVKILELLEPHANVVRYYEHFFDDDGTINIVMEHCEGGDLESLLTFRTVEAKHPLTPNELVYCAFQLFAAVYHLHASGVLHRDMKPSNIFVCRPSATSSSSSERSDEKNTWLRDLRHCQLKVADFGISRVLEHTGSVAKTVVGTPFYLAPELINGETYTNSADMWSLGCVLYELASGGKRCFGGDNLLAVVRAINMGTIPVIDNPQRQALIMPMITPLLQQDPKRRFSAEDCLRAFFLPDEDDLDCEDEFEDPDDEGD